MERGGGCGGSATMFVVVNEERGVEGVRARVVSSGIFFEWELVRIVCNVYSK